jgi:hypothetical protein
LTPPVGTTLFVGCADRQGFGRRYRAKSGQVLYWRMFVVLMIVTRLSWPAVLAGLTALVRIPLKEGSTNLRSSLISQRSTVRDEQRKA